MKPVILVVVVFLAFVAGRYTAPERVVERRQAQAVEVHALRNEESTVTKRRTVIQKPDTDDEVITIEELILRDMAQSQASAVALEETVEKETEKLSKIHLEAWINPWTLKPGISASVQVLGPFYLGGAFAPERPFNIVVGVDL